MIQYELLEDDSFGTNFANIILFGQGIRNIDNIGDFSKPFDFVNLFDTIGDESKPMIFIYSWLILDTLIYLLLYSYIINIAPGSFGQPLSLWFPIEFVFNKLRVCFGRKKSLDEVQSSSSNSESHDLFAGTTANIAN